MSRIVFAMKRMILALGSFSAFACSATIMQDQIATNLVDVSAPEIDAKVVFAWSDRTDFSPECSVRTKFNNVKVILHHGAPVQTSAQEQGLYKLRRYIEFHHQADRCSVELQVIKLGTRILAARCTEEQLLVGSFSGRDFCQEISDQLVLLPE